MIKLSKIADYGIVVLAHLVQEQGALKTATSLSQTTLLPEPTVSKVLKLLAKGKIIRSVRGMNGGYILDRSPEDISVAEIIAVLDGPIALTACVDGDNERCLLKDRCGMETCWQTVNETILQSLRALSFARMLAESDRFCQYQKKGI